MSHLRLSSPVSPRITSINFAPDKPPFGNQKGYSAAKEDNQKGENTHTKRLLYLTQTMLVKRKNTNAHLSMNQKGVTSATAVIRLTLKERKETLLTL